MCEVVINGVRVLLDENSLYIHMTPQKELLIKAANTFIQWAVHPYKQYFTIFSRYLVSSIKSCFTTKSSLQSEREYICTQFHALRTSDTFHNTWSTFLKLAIRCNPGPAFYQHITKSILTIYVDQKYSISQEHETALIPELNTIEHNALRYFAGYLWKNTNSEIKPSTPTHPCTVYEQH